MAVYHEDIGKHIFGTVCPALIRAFTMGDFFHSQFLLIAPFLSIAREAVLREHCTTKFLTMTRTPSLFANTITLAFPAGCAIVDCVTRLRQQASLGRTTWAGHHQGDVLNQQHEKTTVMLA